MNILVKSIDKSFSIPSNSITIFSEGGLYTVVRRIFIGSHNISKNKDLRDTLDILML